MLSNLKPSSPHRGARVVGVLAVDVGDDAAAAVV